MSHRVGCLGTCENLPTGPVPKSLTQMFYARTYPCVHGLLCLKWKLLNDRISLRQVITHGILKWLVQYRLGDCMGHIASKLSFWSWRRHQLETFSALLACCEGNPSVSVTKSSDAKLWCFFDMRLNKRLSKQSTRRWFATSLHSLWRHCNDYAFEYFISSLHHYRWDLINPCVRMWVLVGVIYV